MRVKTAVGVAILSLFFVAPLAARAGVSVVGSLTREKVVKTGESYSGIIVIQNSGEEPQEARVYQTDYLFFLDGSNLYGEPGTTPRSNARWISISPKHLTVPAKGTAEVSYALTVPDDETLTGTYWSMVMVEGISSISPEALKKEKGKIQLGIRQQVRYAIQMVSHIGNTGDYSLKFLQSKLLRENEQRILQIDLENTGERWLRPRLWAELYDEAGNYLGQFEGGRSRLYPGTSVRQRIDLSQVPPGTYQTLVVADCGGENLFGVTYTLKLEK